MEDFAEQAKWAAMDVGLTEFEAENEVADFMASPLYQNEDWMYCDDCGYPLSNEELNAEKEICDTCWAKFNKNLQKLKANCKSA